MSGSPPARLRDARHFASEANRLATGLDPELIELITHHYAIRYCLLVVGEALRNVPAEVRASAPEIPWRAIVGMRHRLAHDYWLVDSRIVLEAADRHAAALVIELDRLIGRLASEAP